MADNLRVDNNGDIYAFACNNIIVVDPNKTIKDGKISERLVDHENLVMFANLEAELTPRTKLSVGVDGTDGIRTISIAKVNFLKGTSNGEFTTGYYDELTGLNTTNKKGTNQQKEEYVNQTNSTGYVNKQVLTDGTQKTIDNGLLGITQITVSVSTSFIPKVTINLEDVQGRALFQLGENSPYAAFFNLPYPPFFLTLKGYYGQAIKYQLYLKSFNASFNSFSGNYQISLELLGYKFTILNEIFMNHLLATPHMYSTKFDISQPTNGQQLSQTLIGPSNQQNAVINQNQNSDNVVVDQLVITKGYQKIQEVYSEYKKKKLIPENFPELTLSQLMNKLNSLEQTIVNNYSKVDLEPLTDIRNYKKILEEYYNEVYNSSGSWFSKYIDQKPYILKTTGDRVFYLKTANTLTPKDIGEALVKNQEAKTKLDGLINLYNGKLLSNKTLGKSIVNNITIDSLTGTTNINDIDWERTTIEQTRIPNPSEQQISDLKAQASTYLFLQSFKGKPFPYKEGDKPLTIEQPTFFIFGGEKRFKNEIYRMEKESNKKLSEVETELTKKISVKIEDANTGLGFKPTVRNVIAVIMASAEGFIRLMDDVHTKAWDVKYDPIRKNIISDSNLTAPSSDSKFNVQITANAQLGDNNLSYSQTPVYPWPQFFKENLDDKKGKYQLRYLGDPELIDSTKGYMYDKWPEVEFVEEYTKGLARKDNLPESSTPTDNDGSTFLLNINAIEFPEKGYAYSLKEEIKYFYEIFERQLVTSYYTGLSRLENNLFENILNTVVEIESKNIVNSLGKNNPYLSMKLKNYGLTSATYIDWLKSISENGSYQDFIRDFFITFYLKSITNNPSSILSLNEVGKESSTKPENKSVLINILKDTKTNEPNVTDIYPFTNQGWRNDNLISINYNQGDNVFNTTNTLTIFGSRNVISNFYDLYDYKKNRPVTNFSYKNVTNPLANTSSSNYNSQFNFFQTLFSSRVPTEFIPTEGYCYFSTPSGNIPVKTTTSILNTPFFINSITKGVEDWKNKNQYPFIRSAYLFLNSLPLISLKEKYKSIGVNLNELDYMFASLKKFGGIHKIPYAWILKIGSIWYRYKNYVNTGNDFLNDVWGNFDYVKNFDPVTQSNTKNYVFNFNGQTGKTIQLENITTNTTTINSGFYPKLISDFNYFYNGYDLYTSYTDSEIQTSLNNGLKLYNFSNSNYNALQNGSQNVSMTTWSLLVPSDIKQTNVGTNCGTTTISPLGEYYVLPSFGSEDNQSLSSVADITRNVINGVTINGNQEVYNGSVRLLWNSPNYGYFDVNQIKKPSFDSYLNKIEGNPETLSPFKLLNDNSYSKIDEIFSVFGKDVLDKFETEFLNFCKPVNELNAGGSSVETPYTSSGDPNFIYKNFQLFFRSLMLVRGPLTNQTDENFFKETINYQFGNFVTQISNFLEYDIIFRFGNPSYYDRRIFDSFLSFNSTVKKVADSINFGEYVANSLPTNGGSTTLAQSKVNYPNEWNSLLLNVGFSTIPDLVYKDSGSYITDFFVDNNIKFTVENINILSPLIKMYATQKLNNSVISTNSFKTQISDYLNKCENLQNRSLDGILNRIRKDLPDYQELPEKVPLPPITDGQQSNVEKYEIFKALNDKWISGINIKDKTLLEDILFLDKASRNIGETIYLDIFSLRDTLKSFTRGVDTSVYNFIATVLIRNNFTIMNLPSYVNYYNLQEVDGISEPKTDSPYDFANSMWGTHLNVDYRKSSPKLVCFYAGKPASNIKLQDSKTYLFKDDGFEMNCEGHPLLENQTNKSNVEFSLSNRCVGFNVDIGIRNQNIFSNFTVSQDNGKATSETIQIQLDIINQAGGKQTSTQNVGLYNLYKNRSYQSKIVALGNAMIQPVMYFNLNHVPMFNGAYMITDVTHTITPGTFQTAFTGVRQGYFDLPSIDNYLQSINENLLTKIQEEILNKKDETPKTSTTLNLNISKVDSNTTSAAIDTCKNSVNVVYLNNKFESIPNVKTSLNEKDFKNLISNNTSGKGGADEPILQASVYGICYLLSHKENKFIGYNNNYAQLNLTYDFTPTYEPYFDKKYSCVVEKDMSTPFAVFTSNENFINFMISRILPRIPSIKKEGLLQYFVRFWPKENEITPTMFNLIKNTTYKKEQNTLRKGLNSAKTNGINVGDVELLLFGTDSLVTPTAATTTSNNSSVSSPSQSNPNCNPPTITSVVPITGTTNYATPITISGTNLYHIRQVTVNNIPCTINQSTSNETKINVVVPPNVNGQIVVSTDHGTTVYTSSQFTYI